MRKIKRTINRKIYRYQHGGKSNNEDAQFMDWYTGFAEKRGLDPDPYSDRQQYDYKGYWNDNKDELRTQDEIEAHLPDEWKLPGHPTFSTQSRYSTDETPGGTWDGNKFIHSPYTQKHWEQTAKYLVENGTQGETSYLEDGTEIKLDENGQWPINKMYPGLNQQKFNDYVDKIRSSRKGVRKNNDGTHSTVILRNGEYTNDKGETIGVAYPSLYQREDGSWYEPEDSVEESKKKKEGYIFDSPEKASWFARGAWKDRYYDRETGKFKDEKVEEVKSSLTDKPLKEFVKDLEEPKKKQEKKKQGGLLYNKFQDGGEFGDDAGHYDEKDFAGNTYTPGENNIHQAYEYSLGKEFGDGFDIDKIYKYFGALGGHEGKGNMVAAQYGGGPGRGLFQIENNKNGGDYRKQYEKFMRIKRLKTPKWYSSWKGNNVSNLGKSEQLELAMAYNYFGNNRKNLLRFMRGEISPGELAALNHKKKFTEKGKVGEKDYKTVAEMREEYVKDVNNLYETQDNNTINKILFDNKYKTAFPNTPDNYTTLTRDHDFGYRCGDGQCALNDEKSGPITTEEATERERVENIKDEYGRKIRIAEERGSTEDIMLGNGRVREKYNNGGILIKKYDGGGIVDSNYDKNNQWIGNKGGVTRREANNGSGTRFQSTMLPNVTVTEDIGDKRRWMVNRGTTLGWNDKGRTYDTRSPAEKDMDTAVSKGGIWAAPVTGYLGMINNGSKMITGGGYGQLPEDGADPANWNRAKAAGNMALDVGLMAATGGLGNGMTQGIKNYALRGLRNKAVAGAVEKYSNGLLHAGEEFAEKKLNNYLKSEVSGAVGDRVMDIATKLKNSNFRGQGNNVFTFGTNTGNANTLNTVINSVTGNVANTAVDDVFKNTVKVVGDDVVKEVDYAADLGNRLKNTLLQTKRMRKGGILYKKK
jgi:hypothetical protein